jgi:nitrate reductase delta subunit
VNGRDRLATLAPMFRYPEHAPASSGGPELAPFFDAIAALDLPALQWAYTSTFDLAPACSPYLGDHVFGDEHRNRARLMVGLNAAYRGAPPAELPDHIAEVFAFAPRFDEEEWRELEALVLQPALKKMAAALDGTPSPYRHLIAAAACVLEETKP